MEPMGIDLAGDGPDRKLSGGFAAEVGSSAVGAVGLSSTHRLQDPFQLRIYLVARYLLRSFHKAPSKLCSEGKLNAISPYITLNPKP